MIDTAAFLLGVKIAWSEYPHNKLIRRLGDRVEKDAINREHERKLKVAVAISKLTSGQFEIVESDDGVIHRVDEIFTRATSRSQCGCIGRTRKTTEKDMRAKWCSFCWPSIQYAIDYSLIEDEHGNDS